MHFFWTMTLAWWTRVETMYSCTREMRHALCVIALGHFVRSPGKSQFKSTNEGIQIMYKCIQPKFRTQCSPIHLWRWLNISHTFNLCSHAKFEPKEKICPMIDINVYWRKYSTATFIQQSYNLTHVEGKC